MEVAVEETLTTTSPVKSGRGKAAGCWRRRKVHGGSGRVFFFFLGLGFFLVKNKPNWDCGGLTLFINF